MINFYTDTFSEYESVFEEAWNIFPIGEKPKWQHWWFYRYLQISRWYRVGYNVFNNQKTIDYIKSIDYDEKTKQQLKAMTSDERAADKEKMGEYNLFHMIVTPYMGTYASFGDVWENDFGHWWYRFGRHQFNSKSIAKADIKDYYYLPTNQQLFITDAKKVFKKFQDDYYEIVNAKSYPPVITLSIPLRKTKKETMKLISKHLDKNVNFSELNTPQGNFVMHKSKMREKTLKDCFKALEASSYQDDKNLVNIAIKANILKGQIKEYHQKKNNLKDMDSLDSLRSSTSRQLKLARLLAENSALGKFPCINKLPFQKVFLNFELHEIFQYISTHTDIKNFPTINKLSSPEILGNYNLSETFSTLITKAKKEKYGRSSLLAYVKDLKKNGSNEDHSGPVRILKNPINP